MMEVVRITKLRQTSYIIGGAGGGRGEELVALFLFYVLYVKKNYFFVPP